VGPGDEVLVPALTFIATANAVRYCGAIPVFVDVEPEHWGMDADLVARFLDEGCHWSDSGRRNSETNQRIGALLPVHLLGHPAPVFPLGTLAGTHGMPVVWDAAEALGASVGTYPPPVIERAYRDFQIGQQWGMSCLSFNGNKLITTGGGGMVLTDVEEQADRVRYLASQAKDDPAEYVHATVGYNYRLSNLQAAVGCAQMERIEAKLAAKRRIAETYGRELAGVPGLTLPTEASWARSNWWMYAVRVQESDFGRDSRALMRHLAERRIETRPLWMPLHLSPAYRDACNLGGRVAEKVHREALSLPCSVGLTESDQARVIEAVRAACR
jgi:perosamine synthetase